MLIKYLIASAWTHGQGSLRLQVDYGLLRFTDFCVSLQRQNKLSRSIGSEIVEAASVAVFKHPILPR